MSTGYPFCNSDCPSVVTSSRHVIRPSVFAFSYVPDNICHTTLLPDPACTFSVLECDSYHDSLHLPLHCDQFLKLGVPQRPGLTPICHYWEYTFVTCFPLQSHWHIFALHPCPILLFISWWPPCSSGSALDSEQKVADSILLWGKFHKNFTSFAQAIPDPIQPSQCKKGPKIPSFHLISSSFLVFGHGP